jgi:hypothetical protein
MGKRTAKVLVLLVPILLFAAVSGCKTNEEDSGDVYGTWVASSGGIVETLTITRTSFNLTDSGSVNGHMNCSINFIDENACHIRATVTSSGGDLSVVPVGAVWYICYSVSGDTLVIGMDRHNYPPAPFIGPYTRQS